MGSRTRGNPRAFRSTPFIGSFWFIISNKSQSQEIHAIGDDLPREFPKNCEPRDNTACGPLVSGALSVRQRHRVNMSLGSYCYDNLVVPDHGRAISDRGGHNIITGSRPSFHPKWVERCCTVRRNYGRHCAFGAEGRLPRKASPFLLARTCG